MPIAPSPRRPRVKDFTVTACQLCEAPGVGVLWQDSFCRVVYVGDADYPGTCRVILNRHVGEMTDLTPRERSRLMKVVFATESALRTVARPDKINLASLGNAVPHVHWHVIPRYLDDGHFPRSIWAQPVRRGRPREAPDRRKIAWRIKALLGDA
jgi:diadenosine tetraphosphate (Ap4A) HIT family hydrolase